MQRNQKQFGWVCALLLAVLLMRSAALSAADGKESRLQMAAHSLASGNLAQAEKDLQWILRDSPQEYRAWDLLGVVRILQKRETDAEDLFLRVVRAKPDFASGHAHLGLLYLQMGRAGEAVPELRAAVQLDPARVDASGALIHIWRDQAQSEVAAGHPERALACLMDARKLAPSHPDVQFEFGIVALQMSLYQDAMEAFQQTLELRKDDPRALFGSGRALMGLSRFEDARQQFVLFVAARPDDATGHSMLGMTLAALQRLPEARTQFEQSIVLDPLQAESYYRLGLMELDSKDLDSAAKNLRVVLDRDPKYAGALMALGRVEFEQKHYAEAADLLRRAMASDDSLAQAHYYLGLTYARMGRKSESDQELQTAVQLQQQVAEKSRTRVKIVDPDNR